ncbi:MAG: helix-turn-helix transcriptional regulator [Selenomonadaceae bacterium]|nr:helix-turn-helix transcriptional regulator [Selenomonadaceae bacterium]
MAKKFDTNKSVYDDKCPLLSAMEIFGSKWKLPIIWYLNASDNQTLRYRELQRRVTGITEAMLTKCLRELERDKIITRKQYNTIPPTVEYSLTENGKSLLPALNSLSLWAENYLRQRRQESKIS